MGLSLHHRKEATRYELREGDEVVALADYQRKNGSVVVFHTEVMPERRGQGLGGELVRRVLDDLAEAGEKVVPACPFVRSYIRDHPAYAHLLA